MHMDPLLFWWENPLPSANPDVLVHYQTKYVPQSDVTLQLAFQAGVLRISHLRPWKFSVSGMGEVVVIYSGNFSNTILMYGVICTYTYPLFE